MISEKDPPHRALFAVEIDGTAHFESQAIRNDKLKNKLCMICQFAIARVKSPQSHHGERGVASLTWLVELFFADRAIDEAYANGDIPPGEYLDPTLFLSNKSIPGKFPLALGLQNRAYIARLHDASLLSSPCATIMTASDSTGRGYCMAIIQHGNRYAVVEDCVFLFGFVFLPEEGAEEIALDRLPVSGGKLNDKGWIDSTGLRHRLTGFLTKHSNATLKHDHLGVDCGFTVTHDWKRRTWVVGKHGRSPEFSVTAPPDDPDSLA